MKKLLTFITWVVLATPLATAQQTVNYIATTGNLSLSSQTTAATLQQPATGSLPVSFPSSTVGGTPPAGASVQCSAACVATISRDCTTPASATAGSVLQINPGDPVPVVQFYTGSNASSCITLAVFNIGAGAIQPIDLSALKLGRGSAQNNLTISIASVTATVNITFYPVEQH